MDRSIDPPSEEGARGEASELTRRQAAACVSRGREKSRQVESTWNEVQDEGDTTDRPRCSRGGLRRPEDEVHPPKEEEEEVGHYTHSSVSG
mmetsp:Transcript_20399/g.81577  ORF Transcript_20399/g.81577 Transcript_20399/m.81577 type:complete len:91 (-) Transcript_20399:603-875(-)